ncbi:MAG: Pyruvate formate-lyase 1-activating enzyme [Firmicutes bacterium ADurb.Bin419]|nr:MAG: Pyruvate formate-lyase 1-activating enzyme [Firmicutes bacterium ADurb.Bin419]
MKIAGLQKNSFVDYPGKICAVIFTPGCNMDCFYCHNRALVDSDDQSITTVEEVLSFLERRKGFLEGVVVSGGEPTLQKGLLPFLLEIKRLGYSIKLDTNGTNPEVVESLLYKGLVDYIAMDFKAPYEKYSEICRTKVDIGQIKKSVKLLMNSGVDYEFRTTLAPGLDTKDIMEIGMEIDGAMLYVLQKCRNVSTEGIGYSADIVSYLVGRINRMVKRVETRGITFCA